MSARRPSATERTRATEDFSRGIQNEADRTARSQGEHLQSSSSRSPPAVDSASTDPFQASAPPIQESSVPFPEFSNTPQNQSSPRRTKGQKRSRDLEDDGANKRRREDLRSASETSGLGPTETLTEDNLRKFQSEFDELDDMDEARTKSLKRAQSQKSMSQASDVYSQKSSSTAAHYRWNILDPAMISVDIGPFPEEVQAQFDPVFKRDISNERKAVLDQIAKDFVDDFGDALAGARRENDCMGPFEKALAALDHDKKFYFPTLADWEPSLKPRIEQDPWDTNFPSESQIDVEDSTTRPRKRQQAETSYPSPDTSALAAAGKVDGRDRISTSSATGPSPPKQDISRIKIPRPDVTMAFRHDTIVDKMVSKGTPNKTMASNYLKKLQRDQELFSNPTQHPIPIRFAVLVVEGKSYATGKPVFEAQNQASVSGSCMNNQQHQLADLTKRASAGSFHSKVLPTGFSICAEGPHIESWGHYTREEDGVRKYKMNIMNTCYATLLAGVVSFFHGLDKIRSWALDTLLDDIGEQLAESERAARARQEALRNTPNSTTMPTTTQGLCA